MFVLTELSFRKAFAIGGWLFSRSPEYTGAGAIFMSFQKPTRQWEAPNFFLRIRKDSKVEVTGTEAKHYDKLMNIITLGTYPSFIRRAIKDLHLTKGESILDLGCDTGRNDCLMLKYISEEGSITGVEIGKEMKEKFLKICNKPNIRLIDKRIDEPMDLDRKFDSVLE